MHKTVFQPNAGGTQNTRGRPAACAPAIDYALSALVAVIGLRSGSFGATKRNSTVIFFLAESRLTAPACVSDKIDKTGEVRAHQMSSSRLKQHHYPVPGTRYLFGQSQA